MMLDELRTRLERIGDNGMMLFVMDAHDREVQQIYQDGEPMTLEALFEELAPLDELPVTINIRGVRHEVFEVVGPTTIVSVDGTSQGVVLVMCPLLLHALITQVCSMDNCPACQSINIAPMFNMGSQPMSLVSLQSNQTASQHLSRYPIRMYICRNCSHVHNIAFNAEYVGYTAEGCRMYNSGGKWQEHVEEVHKLLAESCVVDYIVEIGAGDCEFLANLEIGSAIHCLPIKMAVDPCEAVERARTLGLFHHREYFDADKHIPEDAGDTLVIMRHLLEHLDNPRELIEQIATRAAARDKLTYVYIEVPNCENALRRRRVEDWTYEHPQHFTLRSMKALLNNCGLDHFMILSKYGGEVISCLVKITPDPAHPNDLNVDKVLEGYNTVERAIVSEASWLLHHSHCVAYWGGAGKSAMFLRMLGVPAGSTVVDSHDAKWGMYVPGTPLLICDPDVLKDRPADYIVATTSWRAEDIRDEIARRGIQCKALLKFEGGELVEVPLG